MASNRMQRLIDAKTKSLLAETDAQVFRRTEQFGEMLGAPIRAAAPSNDDLDRKRWCEDLAKQMVDSFKVSGSRYQDIDLDRVPTRPWKADPKNPTVSASVSMAQIRPEPKVKNGKYTGEFAATVWTPKDDGTWQKMGFVPKELAETFPITRKQSVYLEMTDYSNGHRKNMSYEFTLDLEALADAKREAQITKQGFTDLVKKEPFSPELPPGDFVYARPVQFDGAILDTEQVADSFLDTFDLEGRFQLALERANQETGLRKEVPLVHHTGMHLAPNGSGYFIFSTTAELRDDELLKIDDSMIDPVANIGGWTKTWMHGQLEGEALALNTEEAWDRRIPNEHFVQVAGSLEKTLTTKDREMGRGRSRSNDEPSPLPPPLTCGPVSLDIPADTKGPEFPLPTPGIIIDPDPDSFRPDPKTMDPDPDSFRPDPRTMDPDPDSFRPDPILTEADLAGLEDFDDLEL